MDVTKKICAAGPCSGPFARVEVWRDDAGRIKRYHYLGDIQSCSHPPSVVYDASGKEVETIPEHPVDPKSDEGRKLQEHWEWLFKNSTRSESVSCSK